MMRSDAWPQHCRAALVRSVAAAAARFPGPGEEAPKRVHDVRKTLKEARAIARLFLQCVGEPARVTITTLAATRRQIGRARDLDVMALRVQRLDPPPEVSEPLVAAIAREREALRYQLSLLSCAWPEALNAQAEALNDLREALGDYNDLHVLETFAAEHSGLSTQALEELGARITLKQKKLKRQAHVEFERLFAETPSAFATRIAAYLAHPVSDPEVAQDERAEAKSASAA